MPQNPRVLLIADLNYHAKGHSRLQALKRLGLETRSISHTPITVASHGEPKPTLAFRIAWKLGFHLDTEDVNKQLLRDSLDFEPDIIWIEKGNMIKPTTLSDLRKQFTRAVIASYSEDDMFNPVNRTIAYVRGLRHYHIVFITKSYNANPSELPSLGAHVCQFVDKAFDPEQHRPIPITNEERETFGSDIGFIGTYAPERGRDVLFLAENGLSIRVWGNGWDVFKGAHPNLRIERQALINRPDDLKYTKGIIATKINLGFLRKANRDLQTDRSVEIPACGGFMLAEKSTEHTRLFSDGKEAVFYNDKHELLHKAKKYLSDPTARKAIAQAGRKRCVDADYSHDNRMAFMINSAIQQQR